MAGVGSVRPKVEFNTYSCTLGGVFMRNQQSENELSISLE